MRIRLKALHRLTALCAMLSCSTFLRGANLPTQPVLLISNSLAGIEITAYNTVPNVSYQFQTNTDLTNPKGWGVWLTVTATNTVTPLEILVPPAPEVFFRAISMPAAGENVSSNSTNSSAPLYLGWLDVRTNSSGAQPRFVSAGGTNGDVIPGWGQIIDPDGDCDFYFGRNSVVISVPGSEKAHDLAADIHLTNAPRLVQSVSGNFTIQVRTDGRFEPGDQSTQPYRTAYNGAALIVTFDPNNVVTLARAVLQSPGDKPGYYANFELRAAGNLERIGLSGDYQLPSKGPVYLRLQRSGAQITGAVSTNGSNWHVLGVKDIPASWPASLLAGIAAISTSESEFDPRFSNLTVVQP